MVIEAVKHPTEEDWAVCKRCTLVTVGLNPINPPSFDWKCRMLKAEHSPIRTLEFCFYIKDIPYYVSTHLVRHVHATPFVKSQRNDRQFEYDRTKAPQDSLVDMCWYMNAEELMNIAHKRLCRQASPETRAVVEEICNKVIELNPEFESVLVPKCIYRGGRCDEFNCCGYNSRCTDAV